MENRAIDQARRQSHNPCSLRPQIPPPPPTVHAIHQETREEKQILNHLVQKIYEMGLKLEYVIKNIDSLEENFNQLSISLNETSNENRINQIHYNSEETLLVLRNIKGTLENKTITPKRSPATTAKLCLGGASLSPPAVKK
jgi:hypothetical protein